MRRTMSAELPVHYHDVVGVAVIIGDEGFQPQEVFRYPFFNEGVRWCAIRVLCVKWRDKGSVRGLMIMSIISPILLCMPGTQPSSRIRRAVAGSCVGWYGVLLCFRVAKGCRVTALVFL